MIDTEYLIGLVKDQYQGNWEGVHGGDHIRRVMENGLYLAKFTGANEDVIKLFAIFHDSRRVDDWEDIYHGPRGAVLAESWRGLYYDIGDQDFRLLQGACDLHTTADTHSNVTIQTCFDADRLDLGRVGITPDPNLLCTDIARDLKTIEWAYQRSLN